MVCGHLKFLHRILSFYEIWDRWKIDILNSAVLLTYWKKTFVLYPRQEHIFTQGAGGRALTQSETLRRVVIIMSTYEELSLIVNAALLIIAILNYTHKK